MVRCAEPRRDRARGGSGASRRWSRRGSTVLLAKQDRWWPANTGGVSTVAAGQKKRERERERERWMGEIGSGGLIIATNRKCEEEAREKIYSVSTKYYFAISLAVSEEVANKFKKLSEVITVVNFDRDTRFGGEPFVNGKPVPYDPKYHAFYFRVQARIRAGRLADGRSVEEIDRKIAEAGMTIEEVEQKFCNPVDVESGWKSDMSDDEESDGMSDDLQ